MAYYNEHDLQPVHAADAWNLDRYLFTAVAYLARAGKKEGLHTKTMCSKHYGFLRTPLHITISMQLPCKMNVRM